MPHAACTPNDLGVNSSVDYKACQVLHVLCASTVKLGLSPHTAWCAALSLLLLSRAPVPSAADVQVAMLWQWCVEQQQQQHLQQPTMLFMQATHARAAAPHLPVHVQLPVSSMCTCRFDAWCQLARLMHCLHALSIYVSSSDRSMRAQQHGSSGHLSLLLVALQTAAMLRLMAASAAGASCASRWRATSLCATSHTRCGAAQQRYQIVKLQPSASDLDKPVFADKYSYEQVQCRSCTSVCI
jgi:hypothetical protein